MEALPPCPCLRNLFLKNPIMMKTMYSRQFYILRDFKGIYPFGGVVAATHYKSLFIDKKRR